MRGIAIAAIVGGALAASPVVAQPASHGGSLEVRGLTLPEIDELATGQGAGQARAADLYGYPGPRHVLEAAAAGQLELTPSQREAVQRIFADMSSEARRLGAEVLAEEAALEATFRRGTADAGDVTTRLGRLAALRSALRGTHILAHLRTRDLLDPAQIARYQEIRSPGAEPAPAGAPAAGPASHRHGP